MTTPIRDIRKLINASAKGVSSLWHTLTRLDRVFSNGASDAWLVKALLRNNRDAGACKGAVKDLAELSHRRKTILLLTKKLDAGFMLRGEAHGANTNLRANSLENQQILHIILDESSAYMQCVERFLGRYDAPTLAAARRMHHDFDEVLAAFRVDNMMGTPNIAAFKRFVLEAMERHNRLLANSYRTFALAPLAINEMVESAGIRDVGSAGVQLTVAAPSEDVLRVDAVSTVGGVGAPRGMPASVLYIEDNLESLRLMRLVLAKRADLQLIEAETSQAGLQKASARKPALILLDVGLPDLNGYDTLLALRASPDTANIPVIGISAHPPKNIGCGPNVVFDHYITKPFDIAHLMTTMDSALKRNVLN